MQLDFSKLIDIVDPTAPTIFKDHQLAEINRLIKYADYYDGDSFKYISAEFPEYANKKDYRPTKLTINYARYIINKLASWQFEIPIDFNCISDKAEGRADEIEVDLYEIHKKNLMDSKLLQSAVECNISGAVPIKLKYDVEKKQVKIMPRNWIECFPLWEFDDYENIYKVHFVAFKDENTVWKQTFELVNKVCYIEEAIYDLKQINAPKEVIIEYQPLGNNGKWLDFIPVYIIPNLPQIGEVCGLSELKDQIPILDEINKKYSDLSDSLKFDMFAITVFLNAKIPLGPDGKPLLSGKAGAAWALTGVSPTENIKPEVFKLQSEFQYIDSLKYLVDSLLAALYELSEVVNLSVDKISGLSNLSGVALKLLFAAIISKTNKKNVIWEAKLREMYMGVLKMMSIYEGYKIPDDLDIEVISHSPLPANELETVQIHSEKVAAGFESVTSAMNELGIEDPELEIAKIIEEKVKYDKALNIDALRNSHNQGV